MWRTVRNKLSWCWCVKIANGRRKIADLQRTDTRGAASAMSYSFENFCRAFLKTQPMRTTRTFVYLDTFVEQDVTFSSRHLYFGTNLKRFGFPQLRSTRTCLKMTTQRTHVNVLSLKQTQTWSIRQKLLTRVIVCWKIFRGLGFSRFWRFRKYLKNWCIEE